MNNRFGGEMIVRKKYDIMKLCPRKNPYTKTSKKQVTINLDEKVIKKPVEKPNLARDDNFEAFYKW